MQSTHQTISEKKWYQVLGIEETTDKEVIQKAYHLKMLTGLSAKDNYKSGNKPAFERHHVIYINAFHEGLKYVAEQGAHDPRKELSLNTSKPVNKNIEEFEALWKKLYKFKGRYFSGNTFYALFYIVINKIVSGVLSMDSKPQIPGFLTEYNAHMKTAGDSIIWEGSEFYQTAVDLIKKAQDLINSKQSALLSNTILNLMYTGSSVDFRVFYSEKFCQDKSVDIIAMNEFSTIEMLKAHCIHKFPQYPLENISFELRFCGFFLPNKEFIGFYHFPSESPPTMSPIQQFEKKESEEEEQIEKKEELVEQKKQEKAASTWFSASKFSSFIFGKKTSAGEKSLGIGSESTHRPGSSFNQKN